MNKKNKHIENNTNDVLVKVEGLSKKFCKDLKTSLWYGVKDLVSGVRGNKHERQLRPKEFWAVKDVSFELRRGECLGLIGHNGAGKSTLLKILNGLINPDAGKVTIKGRVGALIELGAGFNPILSGRENIYNNGAILGFSRKEIDEKVEAIIDFAEIREFIDMPVQNYSSGMKVRLGFAVAAQMEPDVLIIDEVLAVGDIGFRIKCFNKITALLQKCAVIIVSHSMPQIAKTATVGLLMGKGKEKMLSRDIGRIIEMYNSEFKNSISNVFSKCIKLEQLLVNQKDILNNQINVNFGTNLELDITFLFESRNKDDLNAFFNVILIISDKELKPVATTNSDLFNINKVSNRVFLKLKVPNIRLFPSQYTISMTFNKVFNSDNHHRDTYYYGQNIGVFTISDAPLINNHAVLILDSKWTIKEK
ncbi:ABC transporter ATP-binding protein [Flavobacteriaceae bacterium GSB9]|nr:ABC transporter ATP-binding protein [Flavobacteriaceae bacterium GSB9]